MAHKPRKDLTTGSIRKHILLLSAPLLVAMLMHNLFVLVDTFFVGKLGSEAIAAVAASFPIFFIIIALNSGMGIGVSSAVARAIGAKNRENVNVIAENGLIIAAVISVLTLAIGFFTIEPVVSFLGVTGGVAAFMKDYLSVLYLGSAAFFFGNVAGAMLQGEGDTKTPMKSLVFSNLLNIALDPVFIFGLGPVPAMGVKGAAVATIISVAIGALYLYSHLFSGKALVRLSFRKLAFSWQTIKGILSVSLPTSAAQGAIAVGSFFVNKFVATFGSAALAGFGIAFRIESIAILPGIAIGLATIPIIGQNIGAKNYGRARHASLAAAVAAFALMELIGVMLIFTAPFWLAIFTKDAQVISYGTHYFAIAALAYGFIGLRHIASSSFQGFGKALPVIGITSLNFGSMLLAAYLLAFKAGAGITGLWWGIVAANAVAGIVAQLWFHYTLKRHAKELQLHEETMAAV